MNTGKGSIVWYIFILIAIFLVVIYYKGSTAVGGTFLQGLQNETLFLQGRNAQGQITNYPTGG